MDTVQSSEGESKVLGTMKTPTTSGNNLNKIAAPGRVKVTSGSMGPTPFDGILRTMSSTTHHSAGHESTCLVFSSHRISYRVSHVLVFGMS